MAWDLLFPDVLSIKLVLFCSIVVEAAPLRWGIQQMQGSEKTAQCMIGCCLTECFPTFGNV